VVGDWVYYSCISDAIDNTDYGEKLYCIKTDGTGRQKLNDDRSRNVIVAGDWVYYINLNDFSYNLYRIKTDGSGRQKLNDD
jgi:meiotically up-regulated gene 157 (Mug157) protein